MPKSADAFRTISEVADWLELPPHVLRFWESKFTQVKPIKRAGGRRYYRPNDIILLGGIKHLLHVDGMTIKAVQQKLRTDGVKSVAALSPPLDGADPNAVVDVHPEDITSNDIVETAAPDAPVMIDADVDEFSPLATDTVVDFPVEPSHPVTDSDVPETEDIPTEPVDVVEASSEVEAEPEDVATISDSDAQSSMDVFAQSHDAAPNAPDVEPDLETVEDSNAPLVETPLEDVAALVEETDAVDEPVIPAEPEPLAPEAEITEEAATLPSFLRHGLSDTPAESDDAPEPPIVPETPKPIQVSVPPDAEDFALPAGTSAIARLNRADIYDLRRLSPRLAPLHARLAKLAASMDVQG